eukprot:TRINITY_DN50958_c0_g1_i1.p1 TRINITY_DN50958_c0_g1~~TRINITY_DN50958_c0_g1_i1.p1  ORF type:complete len:282 (+),score=59.63 TRINITY_DN50958_c0_g1_i1:96-941(+)
MSGCFPCFDCNSRQVRLVILDFDNTLAVMHIFKRLAGWESDPHVDFRPFSMSQRGQVRQVTKLDEVGHFAKAGGFATVAFGGPTRIAAIRKVLELLKERDIEVIICSRGFVGVIKKCLDDIGLLDLITEVYANTTSDNECGLPYDDEIADEPETPEETKYCRSEDQCEDFDWPNKADCISSLMKKLHLTWHQAVLLDDDMFEIVEARPLCRTVHISKGCGLQKEHLRTLQKLTWMSGSEMQRRKVEGQFRGRAAIQTRCRNKRQRSSYFRRIDQRQKESRP